MRKETDEECYEQQKKLYKKNPKLFLSPKAWKKLQNQKEKYSGKEFDDVMKI